MAQLKKSLVISAAVLGLGLTGLGTVGAVSAASNTSSTGESSLVEKIANKFGLDKSKVQAVFDEDRDEHRAEMKEKRLEELKQAVTDGKLTQAQADHITSVQNEIETLMGDGSPKDMSTETRDAIKQKMDDLKTWAEEQNLDLKEIGGLGGPRGGHGGPGFGGPRDESSSSTSSSSAQTN
ncbi:MAG: hypothetical protein WBP26_04865 [Candidatus Saccharimonadales bacterium]